MKGYKKYFKDNEELKKLKWKQATYKWKPIEDWIVSENGILFNTKTCQLKYGHSNVVGKDNHQRVSIKNKQYYIAVIVAEAFVKNDDKEKNVVVRHKNDDPLNNHYSNLIWGTHKQNTHDAIINGKIVYDEHRNYTRGDAHANRVLDSKDVKKIIKLLNKSVPLKDIAIKFDVDIDVIRHIYKGNSWGILTEKHLPFPEQKSLRKPVDDKVKEKILDYVNSHPDAKAMEICNALGIERTGTIKAFIGKARKKKKTIEFND